MSHNIYYEYIEIKKKRYGSKKKIKIWEQKKDYAKTKKEKILSEQNIFYVPAHFLLFGLSERAEEKFPYKNTFAL